MREHLTARRFLLTVAAVVVAVVAALGFGLGVLASDQQPSAASPAILFTYEGASWGTVASGHALPVARLGVCQSGSAAGAAPASTGSRAARPACTVSVATAPTRSTEEATSTTS